MDNGAPAPLYSWPLSSRKRRRDPLHLKIFGMWERVTILIFRGNFKLFTVSGNACSAGPSSINPVAGRSGRSVGRCRVRTDAKPPALPLGLAGERKKRARALWTWILKKTSCVRVTNASEKSGCRQTRHEGRRVKRKDRLALQHPSVHEMGAAASFRHPPLLA